MWRPTDVADLHARLSAGGLEESQTFDGKRELGSKNLNIAVDLCAMTVAGGVIVYGLDENSSGTRLTKASLIPLRGVRERLSQIAQTSIAEPPQLEIVSLEEPGQSGMGYVVVTVLPSTRAPHQIVVKGGSYGRFYGRDATGNRILTESEIAALYARRDQIERDVGLRLEEELLGWWPGSFGGPQDRVGVLLRARPLAADGGLTRRAAGPPGASSVDSMLTHVTAEGASAQVRQFEPNLSSLVGLWEISDADHWGARMVGLDGSTELAMRIGHDGQAVLFGRRVGDTVGGRVVVFEHAIAGLTAGFLVALAGLYRRAGYLGAVDVGVIVRPLRGTCGSVRHQQMRERAYPSNEFIRQARFTAGQLEADPSSAARALIGDLTTALVGDGYDPLAVGSWLPR